jgi:hypothetical protein
MTLEFTWTNTLALSPAFAVKEIPNSLCLISRLVVTVLTLFTFTHIVKAQQKPAPTLAPTLVVDLSSLSDKARAALGKAIGNIEKNNSPELGTIRVKSGDSWYGLINRHYGFYDSVWPETAKSYAAMVAEQNNVDINAPLKPGQTLALPALPTRPSTHAKSNITQIMRTDRGGLSTARSERTSAILNADVLPAMNITAPNSTGSKSTDGRTLVVQLAPGEAKELMKMLAADGVDDEIRSASYLGPRDDKTVIEFPHAITHAGALGTNFDPLLPDVSILNLKSKKKLYIVDFMDETVSTPCAHGKKVKEVAMEVLNKSGASALTQNIVPVEVDFYRHKDAAKQILDNYISKNPKNIQPTLIGFENTILSENVNPNDPFRVPVFYLLALVDDIISQNDVGVISSSFYLRFDGIKYLPLKYTPASTTPLFNAVTDADDFIEDDSSQNLVPIREFYDIRSEYGVVLVGAIGRSGETIGMSSRDGTGVTMVGIGDGWGDQTGCPDPADGATSFATPYLATLSFILQAFRETKQLPSSAIDVRRRLSLAVVVAPTLVGRYLSPGSPDITRVLTVASTVVVKKDGSIVEGGLGNAANWIETDNGSAVPDRTGIGPGLALRGFQISRDNTSFVFTNQGLGWKKVKVAGMSIWVVEGGVPTQYTDVGTFGQKYQAVLALD